MSSKRWWIVAVQALFSGLVIALAYVSLVGLDDGGPLFSIEAPREGDQPAQVEGGAAPGEIGPTEEATPGDGQAIAGGQPALGDATILARLGGPAPSPGTQGRGPGRPGPRGEDRNGPGRPPAQPGQPPSGSPPADPTPPGQPPAPTGPPPPGTPPGQGGTPPGHGGAPPGQARPKQPARTSQPNRSRWFRGGPPGLAKKGDWQPPGLAKKGGRPPGQAKRG